MRHFLAGLALVAVVATVGFSVKITPPSPDVEEPTIGWCHAELGCIEVKQNQAHAAEVFLAKLQELDAGASQVLDLGANKNIKLKQQTVTAGTHDMVMLEFVYKTCATSTCFPTSSNSFRVDDSTSNANSSHTDGYSIQMGTHRYLAVASIDGGDPKVDAFAVTGNLKQ